MENNRSRNDPELGSLPGDADFVADRIQERLDWQEWNKYKTERQQNRKNSLANLGKRMKIFAAMGALAAILTFSAKACADSDARAFAFQSKAKVENAGTLGKLGIGPEDIEYTSDGHMKFEIVEDDGSVSNIDLTSGFSLNNSGERKYDRGVSEGKFVREGADGRVIEKKFKVRDKEGNKGEVTIDESMELLGYKNAE